MSSHRSLHLSALALATATLALLTTPTLGRAQYGPAVLSPCLAGEIKCVIKKKSCLLGCHAKAESKGVAVDPTCVQKCRDMFDGGSDPAKGCFMKLEAQYEAGCLPIGDAAAIECKIDSFVLDAVQAIDPGYPTPVLNKCSAGKKKCLIKRDKCLLGVYAKAAKGGVDPAGPDLAPKLQKCRDRYDGGAEPAKGCFAKLEARYGVGCLTSGDTQPIAALDDAFLDDLLAELRNGPNDINDQRCSGDTAVKCTNAPGGGGGPCTGLGTCEFWRGAPLPIGFGGIPLCMSQQWSGGISGTVHVETGASAGTAAVLQRTYNGISLEKPCPRCNGDLWPNDGVAGGTCSGGFRNGLSCDANGSSPFASFGSTSLDCPPTPGALIATAALDLASTNDGSPSLTVSAASPTCDGAPGKLCACASCSGNSQVPCRNDADCSAVAAGTCTNAAGSPREPNACLDDTSVPGDQTLCADTAPVGDGEGKCPHAPFDTQCAIETFRGCLADDDCPAPGDSCTVQDRSCIAGYNGNDGDQIVAQGSHDAPVDNWIRSTAASVFCIPPTGSSALNFIQGLPGPGRIELPGLITHNGTASTCPTQMSFLGTGRGGVMDLGWSGITHDQKVVSGAKVTVNVSCGGSPPCGTCTYTGPVANPNANP